ncbi:MAG: MYXO-CTERM domain-containing protein, partial [Bradymonadia bacterium]
FASAPPGELDKRSLEQDDIDGVCAVFPVRPNEPACAVFPVRPNEPACYQLASNGGSSIGGSGVADCRAQPGQAPASLWWAALGLLILGRRRAR